MGPLTYLVMFGWIPTVVFLFMQFPAQRAVVISFITAWLFLPEAAFIFPGIPDYTKMSATCYGILLATIIFDSGRFNSFRLGWLDLPMLIWCLCPIASSLTNDLGLYDGLTTALSQTVTWGAPYFLGRMYLQNLSGLRQLVIGMFIGGLIYIPFCLMEMRIGPQLHQLVYGFSQTINWAMAIRYGGFRPVIFMENGLMVGVWMMSATLIGIWLWNTKILTQVWGIPISWLVGALLVTFVLCRSTGAYFLLLLGVIFLFCAKWFRSNFPVLLVSVAMCVYLYFAATGNFVSEPLVRVTAQIVNEERAGSMDFRFQNEVLLSEKARQQPVFGWGGWGRSRVYNQAGEDISITDSLWIIAFGTTGTVGLISLTAALLGPVVVFSARVCPGRLWAHPKVAPAALIAVLLALYMLDCILNAMVNPIFTLAAGGLTGFVLKEMEPSPEQHYVVQKTTVRS